MEKEQFSYVGKIIKTPGYKGEILAQIEAGFIDKFKKTEFVFVEIQHEQVPFLILSRENKYHHVFLFSLDDIDTVEKAQKLTGCRLFIAEQAKKKKISGDFELKELIGFEVQDKKSGKIGKIACFLELPQQQIMQIFKDKKEILIPFNEAIVLAIDVAHKTVTIRAPEGLIDHYLK
ncbi:MAG TPA: ribosome maturation factor RimM [Bacteroidales bacterium]|nr:16S rRNA processing protein RimM [Bacteroidales bacterium]HNZ42349.1 ribosome maturation factor RimM [Bacteroidales bacterium]HOH84605.1 ribosome maturation factor RimM [Bacteroidales bacterium]HPB24811.1 ribosome maturation factor RimM [Bacteroidales bacterium]HPI29737.1 ribosome maturation factor RimM [Bacteroidales bacterium]